MTAFLLSLPFSASAHQTCQAPGCAASEPYHGMPEIANIGARTGKYMDIPESAKGPAIDPAKGYRIQALGRGLFADPRTVEVSLGAVGSPQAWAPLQVAVTDGRPLPGWWRREGRFVVTTVYAVGSPTAGPPPPVGETTALARAVPVSRGSRAGG